MIKFTNTPFSIAVFKISTVSQAMIYNDASGKWEPNH